MNKSKKLSTLLLLSILLMQYADTNAQLKVSENNRYLVTADGQPFFWLGD
jgi:hypothetical protein